MPLQKVVAIKDNDGHWFVIPSEHLQFFRDSLHDAEKMDDYEAFEESFSKYRTGGDLNNIQLYAEI